MSPKQSPRAASPTRDARAPGWPEGGKASSRLIEWEPEEVRMPPRAFGQQEAALQRIGAQLRAANEQIEGIKQRLQAQISPKKR